MKEFDRLVSIMKELREKCPWDREQNLSSLRKYLIEESYESLEALENFVEVPSDQHFQELKEELGDLLLQVLFQTKILQEIKGGDPLKDSLRQLEDKLIRRHPHVFGEKADSTQTADAALQQWNKIKETEKSSQKPTGLLQEVAKTSPAMAQSHEIGNRCAKIGFDWLNSAEVWSQVQSELNELTEAQTPQQREDEWGDVVFSLIQWARHQKFDPEVALARMNQRFRKRFEWMEDTTRDEGKTFAQLSRDEMEKLWTRAKAETQ
jgi:tetrapyrrole methylase family protein/MazG family protein